MSSILRNELHRDVPLELIDEILSWNEDNMTFLRSASLVSKAWRAAALRYLFSEASFLCKYDFVRWRLIGASLPHVAQYVRKVVFDLGAKWRLRKRAESMRAGLIACRYDLSNIHPARRSLFTSAPDFSFPEDSEFDVSIPVMRSATSLTWTTPSIKEGFDPTAANVTRFLQSFPNITSLSCRSNLFRPGVQEHIMSFFHNLRQCRFTSWCRSEESGHVYVFPVHGSRINVSQLEEIWFEECKPGSMDWLVDNVLHHFPSRIRKLGWECGDLPFSSNHFARLLLMVHGTLEELCFRPPWSNDRKDYQAPPFNLAILPVLRILSFRFIHMYTEAYRIKRWLTSIFAVFPSCPSLQRLEFTFHLIDSGGVDIMFASQFLDWNSLLQGRYPSLKVLEFEMIVVDEQDLDHTERKRVETTIRQSTEMVHCDKFVIRWS